MSDSNQDELDRVINRWGLSIALGLFMVLGVMGVVIFSPKGHAPDGPFLEVLPKAFFEHLFMALAVASFIGLFVELTLQRQLAKNVFAAALGYLLPERLKPELRWIYDQKIIATQSFDAKLEHIEEERRVIFHGRVKRRIENVSDRTVPYRIGGGIEEQFSKNGESEIIAWTIKKIEKDKEEKNAELKNITPVPNFFGFGNKEKEEQIAPNQIIEVMMSYKLYLPDHGDEYLTYRCLIDRPSVTIESPPSLKVGLTFSHRDNEDFPIAPPVTSHTLERVLLPHQDIKITWHNAKDVEQRAKQYGIVQ